MNIAGGKSAAPEFERQFLGELAEELVIFRGAFEQLLGVLSGFKREEAKPLVKQSLEAIDEMNNALALYKDVRFVTSFQAEVSLASLVLQAPQSARSAFCPPFCTLGWCRHCPTACSAANLH